MSNLWYIALLVFGTPAVIGVPWLLAGWLLKRELSGRPHPSANAGQALVRAAELQAREHRAAVDRIRGQARAADSRPRPRPRREVGR